MPTKRRGPRRHKGSAGFKGLHRVPTEPGGPSELDQAKFRHRMANEALQQKHGNRKRKGLKRKPNPKKVRRQ